MRDSYERHRTHPTLGGIVVARYLSYCVVEVPSGFKMSGCPHIAHDTVSDAVGCPQALRKMSGKSGFRRQVADGLVDAHLRESNS